MEKNLRTLALEMKEYYSQISNYADLTTIQKKEYQINIQKTFESRSIQYNIHFDDEPYYGGDSSYISFIFPSMGINDVGIINDVREKGSPPIHLNIDDNIEITYEPRNFEKITNRDVIKGVSNSEYLYLKKGSDYQFHGKLKRCVYYFKSKQGGKNEFRFDVVGYNDSETVNIIDINNQNKATRSGVLIGLLGAGFGFAIGIGICLVLSLIILPIYSWSKYGLGSPKDDSQWPTFVIIISTIVGAVSAYYDEYSRARRELRK